jgi:glycosyltransferase involved in cell wall biosynthesis
VLAANTSSLPEVVGEAGVLVDPLDVDALAGAIQQLVHDQTKRRRMIAAGLRRAASFSWQYAATQALQALL